MYHDNQIISSLVLKTDILLFLKTFVINKYTLGEFSLIKLFWKLVSLWNTVSCNLGCPETPWVGEGDFDLQSSCLCFLSTEYPVVYQVQFTWRWVQPSGPCLLTSPLQLSYICKCCVFSLPLPFLSFLLSFLLFYDLFLFMCVSLQVGVYTCACLMVVSRS